MMITSALPDHHLLRPNAVAIPIWLRSTEASHGKGDAKQIELLAPVQTASSEPAANLSANARTYLTSLGIENPDADAEAAELIWMHTVAIGYAPAYLTENADGIRRDWPRMPLPSTQKVLLDSAALGRQIALLLDTETPVKGVTSGAIRPELKAMAIITRSGGGALDPDAGDLNVTAGWGHGSKGGVIMPGQGKAVGRRYTAAEEEALGEGARALGLTVKEATELLGEMTYDVYLNDSAHWKNVPARVWDYTVGGYQVIKKWLSYREHDILGRSLTSEEVREVMNVARRIAAILLQAPAQDTNYQTIKQSSYHWPAQTTHRGEGMVLS